MNGVHRARPGWVQPGDAALVAMLAVPLLMDAWWSAPGTRPADAWTYSLVLLMLVSLLVRATWPIAVAATCGFALTVLTMLGHSGELLALPALVALYEIAIQGGRRRTVVTAVLASSWLGVLGLISRDPLGAPGGSPVIELLLPLVPLAMGEAARSRREVLAATQVAHEARTASRIADERARMAREVHDVVGHTLAGVTIQLAAAETAFDVDRDVARAALGRARTSATEAMAVLRSTVEVLRADPGAAPPPSLTRLEDLLSPVRRAGIDVTLSDDLPAGTAVPAAASLAAYRVIQEALTNVVRHSGARHAWVDLTVVDGHLHIRVADDGQGSGPTPDVSRAADARAGFGLRGMAERVAAAHGELTFGTRAGGGFVVAATLPLAMSRAWASAP